MSEKPPPATLPDSDGASSARAPDSEHLHLLLSCEEPLAPPLRVELGPFAAVTIGRGVERDLRVESDGAGTSLTLRLPDGWLSTRHCTLSRRGDRTFIADAGSRNGTFVGPVRVTGETALHDGAVIEIGHTFFLYRSGAGRLPAGPIAGLTTGSSAFAIELEHLARVAPTRLPVVLFRGATGTGKELLARAVHAASGRSGALVAVNCAALPPTLFEAELFGYRKGAFTGATHDHVGLVRESDGGTLFLDEIGDLTASSQAAVLRVLQESEVVPLGTTRPLAIDLRIVAATHADLPARVTAGAFRADLWGRLQGLCVRVPPLCERREDLGALIAELLRRATPAAAAITFRPEAARALLAYDWPLNVRELERCLASAVALAAGAPIGVEHLGEVARRAPSPAPPVNRAASLRATLEASLAEHGGNVTAVARALGKSRTQVQRWLRKFGLEREGFTSKTRID